VISTVLHLQEGVNIFETVTKLHSCVIMLNLEWDELILEILEKTLLKKVQSRPCNICNCLHLAC
jgi:hypothetical protein